MTIGLAFLLLAAPLRAASPENSTPVEAWDMRLADFDGDVEVFTKEDPEGVEGEEGMPLDEGDRVKTGEDSEAEIALENGSVIMLSENTEFTVAAARKDAAIFSLGFGSLLAKVKSLLAGARMSVRTPTAVASIRGTEFGVETEPGGTHVGVFDEGQVEVQGDSGAPSLLGPGAETSALPGMPALAPAPLKRFVRHHMRMKVLRKRFAALAKRKWKTLSPERRRELRQSLRERSRHRRAMHRRGPGARPRPFRRRDRRP